MLGYVKISYKTRSANYALKKCIEFIGKYYGNNRYNHIYKSGKAFLAKKVKGASKTSINYMVYPKKVKNSEMKEWRFKKVSYDRAYRYIIYKMLQTHTHEEEAISLLHSLFIELKMTNNDISKILSNILVLEEKDILMFAKNKPQYISNQKIIQKILKSYNDCDVIYQQCLKQNKRWIYE